MENLGKPSRTYCESQTPVQKHSSSPLNLTYYCEPAIDNRKVTNTKLPNQPAYKAMFQGVPPNLQGGIASLTFPPH